MEVPYYSFSDYKRIATAFLRKHGFPRDDKLPVDIELLIDKAGIETHPVHRMFVDYGVKGAVLKKTGGYDIAIDEQQYDQHEFFFRFTLAEELAHILLHEKLVAGVTSLDDLTQFHKLFSDEEYRKIDQQARCLASHLLLPSQVFDDYVIGWMKQNESAVRSETFFSSRELAEFISEKLYRKLLLSKDVVRTSILRPPDSTLDKVISLFGQDLIK